MRDYWRQLLIFSLLIGGIVATLILVQRQQILKSKAVSSNKMTIGFNVTGLPHYGYDDLFPFTSKDDVDETLKEIQRLGGKVVRVWIANEDIDDEQVAERLDKLLSKAEKYNISLLISLINYYHTKNNPKNFKLDKYYEKVGDFNPLLTDEFFRDGWRCDKRCDLEDQGKFERFVEVVVSKNKHHQNIFAWEIGNELQGRGNQQNIDNFINFIKDVSCKIKGIDSNHDVSSGFLNSAHAQYIGVDGPVSQDVPERIYGQIKKCVDIVSVVNYNSPGYAQEADVLWAVKNNKTPILAEAGFNPITTDPKGRMVIVGDWTEKNGNGTPDIDEVDRSSEFSWNLNYWQSKGAQAYLVWGFVRKKLPYDNGNADKLLGMDNLCYDNYGCHRDYDQIAQVLQKYSEIPRQTKDLKLVRIDLSNTGTFSSGREDRLVSLTNSEQLFEWSYSNLIYVKEYWGEEGSLDYETIGYRIDLEDGTGIRIGNTAIKVNTK